MSFSLENCVKEFNINRKIIIRNCPIVTYEEVKRFLGNFKISNIAISKRHKHSIVELRHGEEAEKIVSKLNGKNLCGKQVTVSLFRQDNLLCVCNIPETMDDFDWRSVVLPFGIIEKAFVMRNVQGESLGYAFVEFMHNREKSEQARRHIQQLKLSINHNLRCVFLADHVTTFDQLYSRIIMVDYLPVDCSLDAFQRLLSSLDVPQPIIVQMGMKCAKTSSKFALLQYETHSEAYKAWRSMKEFKNNPHKESNQKTSQKHPITQHDDAKCENTKKLNKSNENGDIKCPRGVKSKSNNIPSNMGSMAKLEVSFCTPGEKVEDLMKQISSFNNIFSETVDCSCVHPMISQLLHNHQPIHDDFNSLLKMKNSHTNSSCILNNTESFYHQLTLLNDFLETHKKSGLKDRATSDQDIISNIQNLLSYHSGVDVMRGVDMSVAYQNIVQQQLIIQQQQQILLQQKQIEKKLQQQKQQSTQPIIPAQQLQAPIIYQQLPANLLPQPYITPSSYQPLAFYPVINPSIPYAYPVPAKHFVPLAPDASKIPAQLNDVNRSITANQLTISNTNNSASTVNATAAVINSVDMVDHSIETSTMKTYILGSGTDAKANGYNRVPFNERNNNYSNDLSFHKNGIYNYDNNRNKYPDVIQEENKENIVYSQSNKNNNNSINSNNNSNIDDVINSILSNYKNKININDYSKNVKHQQEQPNKQPQQNHDKQPQRSNYTTQRATKNTTQPTTSHQPRENLTHPHTITPNESGVSDDRGVANEEEDDEQYVMARTDCDCNEGSVEDEDFQIKSENLSKDGSTDAILNCDEEVHDVSAEDDNKEKHVMKSDLNDLSFYSYSKVICNGIYGNLATIVDNCCSYNNQQETPIRRPDRVPGFIQSPEASPEGWYVGQHSQGLGGHYEESLLRKRNYIMQ